MEEEDRPRPIQRFEPRLLDALGVEELDAYRGALRTEIARVEAAMDARRGHRSAADAMFRRPANDAGAG